MSRVDDLERDRQIADIKAILASSQQRDPDASTAGEEWAELADGESERRSLTGFGDGFDPPRTAWRARLHGRRAPTVVFIAVAVLTAAATALVTWLLRPGGTAVPGATATIAAADERADGKGNGDASLSPAPPEAATSSTTTVVVVAVVGSVNSPGLVSLPDGSRVSDAIAAAGGVLPGTDLSTINIARKVADGEQIVVGLPGPPADSAAGSSGGGGAADAGAGSGQLIDLNTAGLEQLDSLPGIGPVLAQRIIDFRDENGPFKTVDELQNVSGVGPAVLAKIKDQVTV